MDKPSQEDLKDILRNEEQQLKYIFADETVDRLFNAMSAMAQFYVNVGKELKE